MVWQSRGNGLYLPSVGGGKTRWGWRVNKTRMKGRCDEYGMKARRGWGIDKIGAEGNRIGRDVFMKELLLWLKKPVPSRLNDYGGMR